MTESEPAAPAAVDTIEPEPAPPASHELAADPDPATDAPTAMAVAPDAAPESETGADLASPILDAIARLDDRLEESQRLLVRQSEIASSLHAENQRLKSGELTRAQLPLVRDIIRVQDDLRVMHDVPDESIAATDLPAVRRHLSMARESLIDALARNGVEELSVELDKPFDPRRHKAVKVTTTAEPTADRTVAEVVKSGFAWDDGTPIRAADVRVFKYAAPAIPAAGETAGGEPQS